MALSLILVTPEGETRHEEVDAVVLPGVEGEFGVLPSHERFLTALGIGPIEIRKGGASTHGAISSGFAAVDGSQVVVMVESGELAADIDVARAELARERAERGLAELGATAASVRVAEYEAGLARAKNRLKVAKRA